MLRKAEEKSVKGLKVVQKVLFKVKNRERELQDGVISREGVCVRVCHSLRESRELVVRSREAIA